MWGAAGVRATEQSTVPTVATVPGTVLYRLVPNSIPWASSLARGVRTEFGTGGQPVWHISRYVRLHNRYIDDESYIAGLYYAFCNVHSCNHARDTHISRQQHRSTEPQDSLLECWLLAAHESPQPRARKLARRGGALLHDDGVGPRAGATFVPAGSWRVC